ncbi:MAG: C10 family peptidase [Muribaculaceae bacterium]|nr:C10 family peptidase [Muribaculaceae bacterium]
MKKLLFLTLTIVVACSAAMAAPVDALTAQMKAQQYIQREAVGKLMAQPAGQATLIKTEMGDKAKMPVYYIFNTATNFIIVSGDDRAEEILAVGDEPLLDIENMPDNMKAWLHGYAEQLDWLLCNPDAKVVRASDTHVPSKATYGPLLTCNWDQSAPYYNQCKFTYNGTTYQCVTGCPATSASMVMYYWKWPVAQVGPLASYTSTLDIGSYNSNEVSFTYPALDATTFDWANMKDTYRSYTTAQGNAVATLMRYVGQSEQMMYGRNGSGIYTTQSQKIANTFKAFGYNQNTVRLVSKSNYNESAWASLLQTEMAESRPVVYLGVDNSAGGHAFNVDGYRSSDNTYHVNFGWSGQGNNWCTMNAFSDGDGYTFNQSQQMVIGIEPPEDYFDPTIVANPTSVTFSDCYATRTYTQTFNVRGINLSGDITISKSGSNVFSVSPTTISAADASNGVEVTVTYAPTAAGNATGTLTLTSSGAPSQTVSLSGTAQAATPTLVVNSGTLNFSAGSNTTVVKTISLTGRFITNDVTLTLNDPSGVFSLSRAVTIPAADISETNPVDVLVSFNSATQGTFTGSVTIASNGAQTQTVQLNATADDSGTASDAYLNIAKYETIDQAGWTSDAQSYVTKFYGYTEYPADGAAWLTMPVFGAWCGARYGGGTQKWIKTSATSASYSTVGGVTTAWDANEPYLGSAEYYDGKTVRRFGVKSTTARTEYTVTFYITNATEVKLSGVNLNATLGSYPTTMKVYECTKNADGTLTEGTSTITGGNLSNTTRSATIDFDVTLDASKIYKVVAGLYRAQFTEIAFKTEIPAIATNPAYASISVNPGESKTQTLTISGKRINDDVSITLNDPQGLFSISTTSVSLVDALAGTATVDVTFNGPEEYGDYEASMTLTSGDITNTVPLYGTVADMGTARSEYLDIKRYSTLDENDWYSDVCVKPYEYTIDEDNECAWLTMPAAVSVYGWAYDEWSWHWANGANSDNPFYLYSGIDWNSMDVFKGCSPYFGSMTARVFGPPTLASGSTASANDYALLVYCVTNCDQVKAMCYNVAPDTSHPTEMEIYDITNGWDISDDTFVGSWEDNTNYSDVVIESEDLDPTKVYAVIVLSYQGVVEEMAFRTPVAGAPKTPIDVEANPGSTTAEITWTPGENNDSWNLRWRPWVDMLAQNRFWDFEDASQYGEFTFVDNDGDGHNWGRYSGDGLLGNGTYAMLSEGYDFDNNAWLENVDNWMITPKVKLGGSVSFYAAAQYGTDYGTGPVAVYVYQGDTWNSVSQFVQVGSDQNVTGTLTKYTYDLSAYSGPGYVAIVHHNDTGTPYLNVDDIEVLVPDAQEDLEEYEWNYCDNVTSPYVIEGLEPETTYEVQVQGVNEAGVVGNWTESTIFTTLPITSATLATIEGEGVKGETYTISDELVAVYADVENGILWCKDQGNVSIAATFIKDGQIDFMRDASICGTTGQQDEWDQSNWVALKFTEATSDNGIESLLNGAVGKKIKAGTVTGVYTDNRNFTIEVLPANGNYTLTFNGSADYTKNVYCAANFLESNLNLTAESTGAVDGNGTVYFFMNPKIQEVCEITYAMWDGEKFVTPDNTGIEGAFNVDWSRNSVGTPTLQEGKTYRFIAVVTRPAKLGELRGGGEPSDNYVIYPANLSGDSNIVTGINGVYTDGYRGDVVGVDYVNAAGVVSKTPFQGVNIVVTRYSDGSKTTSKKIFK